MLIQLHSHHILGGKRANLELDAKSTAKIFLYRKLLSGSERRCMYIAAGPLKSR